MGVLCTQNYCGLHLFGHENYAIPESVFPIALCSLSSVCVCVCVCVCVNFGQVLISKYAP